jgi:serine/threonine-protein kinase
MGRVWVAEHLTLETNVIVKFMASDIAATADGAARFAREASVAAAVKSPHVVQVFDHGVTSHGDAYIVMELLEGRDLAAHLAASGPMVPRDVAALVAQVAKALGKAHQVGVVHRDIKPDNIFLCDADGGELFVKLLDFGIAKRDQHHVTGANTTTGAVIGTPYYMSPEQIIGDKDLDARSDIWSLGVVAFEAMTGRRPFEGTTVGAITLAIHTGTRRISDHLLDAPSALDEWFSRVCARDPKTRFQTAREAAQALLRAVGDVAPASVPLLRAPMPSIVGDGSDPSLESRESRPDLRAATHLSSAFPVPRPSRGRPVIAAAAVGGVLLVIAATLAIPALLRPRDALTKGAAKSVPSATLEAAASAATAALASASVNASSSPVSEPSAVPAVSSEPRSAQVTPVTSPHAAGGSGGVVPSRNGSGITQPAAATTGRPATRPSTTTTPGRATKPGRTRDDDDIK